jgi:hypothetical protein
MLGFIAAVIFAVAFVLSAAAVHTTSALLSPYSLLFAGLTFLALHLGGVGSGWTVNRRP